MFHHHNHDHSLPDYHRAFAFGVALNLGYIAVEATFGILAGSLALLVSPAFTICTSGHEYHANRFDRSSRETVVGDDDEILEKAGKELHDRFGIEHTTIQWERRYQLNQCGNSCEILK